MSDNGKLLDVQHVTVVFHIGRILEGSLLTAVNDVSFSLENDKPEIFTLARESGSGKTTLSRLLLRELILRTWKGCSVISIARRHQMMFVRCSSSFQELVALLRYRRPRTSRNSS